MLLKEKEKMILELVKGLPSELLSDRFVAHQLSTQYRIVHLRLLIDKYLATSSTVEASTYLQDIVALKPFLCDSLKDAIAEVEIEMSQPPSYMEKTLSFDERKDSLIHPLTRYFKVKDALQSI